MKQFFCKACHKIFEAEGLRVEWKDPIYGPCFKYVADCPACKSEVTEYRPPKTNSGSHSHGPDCGCCSRADSCGMAGNF